MKYHSPVGIGSALVLGFGLALAGCKKAPLESPAAAPTSVTVSHPVEREVTDYADFTARTAAVDSVEVRAHVWGYLDKVNFKEGALVTKGDVLFELDPRPYEAEYGRVLANLNQAKAHLTRTEADFKRADDLLPQKAISPSDYDLAKGNRDEAAAAVEVAEAAVYTAKLNLDFTKITAPISGRVSRYIVTVGNLILSGDQQGGTLLTNIVSVDPMYAYFDVDEHTVLRVRQLAREGKAVSPREGVVPVWLGLATEDGYPHEGTIDFVDNQINPKTGTMRVRGVFPNTDQVLTPGLFARVRAPIGLPHKALLVNQRAFDSDQGQKIVYVVDKDNKVVSRPVGVGAVHDGLRAVDDGLKPGEQVIVIGLQQVRPGITVEPRLVDMPIPLVAGARKSERR